MTSDLLSRMAETLFWTGRYIERADDTARLVDVYVHRLLGDPGVQRAESGADCGPLFGLLGVEPEENGITGRYFQYEAPVAWARDG